MSDLVIALSVDEGAAQKALDAWVKKAEDRLSKLKMSVRPKGRAGAGGSGDDDKPPPVTPWEKYQADKLKIQQRHKSRVDEIDERYSTNETRRLESRLNSTLRSWDRMAAARERYYDRERAAGRLSEQEHRNAIQRINEENRARKQRAMDEADPAITRSRKADDDARNRDKDRAKHDKDADKLTKKEDAIRAAHDRHATERTAIAEDLTTKLDQINRRHGDNELKRLQHRRDAQVQASQAVMRADEARLDSLLRLGELDAATHREMIKNIREEHRARAEGIEATEGPSIEAAKSKRKEDADERRKEREKEAGERRAERSAERDRKSAGRTYDSAADSEFRLKDEMTRIEQRRLDRIADINRKYAGDRVKQVAALRDAEIAAARETMRAHEEHYDKLRRLGVMSDDEYTKKVGKGRADFRDEKDAIHRGHDPLVEMAKKDKAAEKFAELERKRDIAINRHKEELLRKNAEVEARFGKGTEASSRYIYDNEIRSLEKTMNVQRRYIDILREKGRISHAEHTKMMADLEKEHTKRATALAEKSPDAIGTAKGSKATARRIQQAFQGQQMIEDFQYAGFRGASNNIAALAANTRNASLAFTGLFSVVAIGIADTMGAFDPIKDMWNEPTRKMQQASDAARSLRDAVHEANVEMAKSPVQGVADLANRRDTVRNERAGLRVEQGGHVDQQQILTDAMRLSEAYTKRLMAAQAGQFDEVKSLNDEIRVLEARYQDKVLNGAVITRDRLTGEIANFNKTVGEMIKQERELDQSLRAKEERLRTTERRLAEQEQDAARKDQLRAGRELMYTPSELGSIEGQVSELDQREREATNRLRELNRRHEDVLDRANKGAFSSDPDRNDELAREQLAAINAEAKVYAKALREIRVEKERITAEDRRAAEFAREVENARKEILREELELQREKVREIKKEQSENEQLIKQRQSEIEQLKKQQTQEKQRWGNQQFDSSRQFTARATDRQLQMAKFQDRRNNPFLPQEVQQFRDQIHDQIFAQIGLNRDRGMVDNRIAQLRQQAGAAGQAGDFETQKRALEDMQRLQLEAGANDPNLFRANKMLGDANNTQKMIEQVFDREAKRKQEEIQRLEKQNTSLVDAMKKLEAAIREQKSGILDNSEKAKERARELAKSENDPKVKAAKDFFGDPDKLKQAGSNIWDNIKTRIKDSPIIDAARAGRQPGDLPLPTDESSPDIDHRANEIRRQQAIESERKNRETDAELARAADRLKRKERADDNRRRQLAQLRGDAAGDATVRDNTGRTADETRAIDDNTRRMVDGQRDMIGELRRVKQPIVINNFNGGGGGMPGIPGIPGAPGPGGLPNKPSPGPGFVSPGDNPLPFEPAGFADGGMVGGPAGVDNIHAMLSAGEVVLTRQHQELLARMAGTGSAELLGAVGVPGFRGRRQAPSAPKPRRRRPTQNMVFEGNFLPMNSAAHFAEGGLVTANQSTTNNTTNHSQRSNFAAININVKGTEDASATAAALRTKQRASKIRRGTN